MLRNNYPMINALKIDCLDKTSKSYIKRWLWNYKYLILLRLNFIIKKVLILLEFKLIILPVS
jgi:hypothetical protein